MRPDVLEWGRSVLTAERVAGKRVLEVGSMDVNGSLRPFVEALGPSYYVGVDIAMGPGVDRVLNAKGLVDAYGAKKWDLVICAEMLEHCPEWQEAVYQMKESLDDDGWIVVTTVGPGFPNHDWPGDYWRFTGTTMTEALGDLADLEVIVRTEPESSVFAIGRRAGAVAEPRSIALPAPTKDENSNEIMVWPELDRMLANAVHAVRNGKLDPQIVIQSFERFKGGISG
jgi:SAM-dependent methyltransferase